MRTYLAGTIAALAALCLSIAALAAAPPTRVRGTVTAINGSAVTVRGYDGATTEVTVAPDTHYAWIVPSSLAEIKPGDFIGTAATGPDSALMAQEVVIFPDAMRGAGEGHYPWSMPEAVAKADAGGAEPAAGAPAAQGTMTNGTVAAAAPAVPGTMTNGTVTAAGAKSLMITYDKGQKIGVTVPPNVPIVRFEPEQQSILKTGEKVFIVAIRPEGGEALTARFVGVGKDGLMPPM